MKKGFTLTEVLIALTIVGTIAALTLPSILSTYKYKLYTTQLNRAYAQIVTAVNQAIADEHADNYNKNSDTPTGFYATSAAYSPHNFLMKYFKQGKKCTDANKYCGTNVINAYKNANGNTFTHNWHTDAVISTSNGAVISMISIAAAKSLGFAEPLIFLDVNGEKDPNIIGYDAFYLKINNNGTITDIDDDPDKCGTSTTNNAFETSKGCFARFVENGNEVKKF